MPVSRKALCPLSKIEHTAFKVQDSCSSVTWRVFYIPRPTLGWSSHRLREDVKGSLGWGRLPRLSSAWTGSAGWRGVSLAILYQVWKQFESCSTLGNSPNVETSVFSAIRRDLKIATLADFLWALTETMKGLGKLCDIQISGMFPFCVSRGNLHSTKKFTFLPQESKCVDMMQSIAWHKHRELSSSFFMGFTH